MKRENLQSLDANRSREPDPLNRPPGTFSPTGGEGQEEGVRFVESLDGFATAHRAHDPGVVASRQSAAIRGNNQPAALCRDAATGKVGRVP